jgi:hypothetical protein
MKILIIVSLCFVLISLAFFPLYALELVKQDEKKIVRVIEGDFDGDGGIDTVTLVPKKSKTSEYMDYDLEIKSKVKDILIKNVLVDEGELFCGLEKIVVSPKITPFIGISYHTGAYSWMLKLYYFDGKAIRRIEEFGSDGQSIQVKDANNDGENEIVTTNRDWDHNSVEDHIIDTYKYNGKKWALISTYETKTKNFIPIVKKR